MAHPTGADIANVALGYKGVAYTWGGYLPSTGWDCSGAVGSWLGKEFGLTLPGGYKWTGHAHGPIASQYKIWSKASTVATAQAGDLCCWLTHVGIATGANQMISAYDTQLGTAITPITAGPTGEPLSIRRINTVGASNPPGVVSTSGLTSGCAATLLLMPYLIVKGVVTRGRRTGSAAPGS